MEDLAYVARVGARREPGKPSKLELVDKHEHARNVEVPSDRDGVDTSNHLYLIPRDGPPLDLDEKG